MVCDEVTAASAVEAERGIGLVVESLGYDVQRVGGNVSGDGGSCITRLHYSLLICITKLRNALCRRRFRCITGLHYICITNSTGRQKHLRALLENERRRLTSLGHILFYGLRDPGVIIDADAILGRFGCHNQIPPKTKLEPIMRSALGGVPIEFCRGEDARWWVPATLSCNQLLGACEASKKNRPVACFSKKVDYG